MKIGVLGAGTMGSGIAQAFAQTEGYEVMLCDVKAEWAENGKAKIAKGLNKRVAKGKMEQAAADAILAKITTGTNEIVADCDLVGEDGTEEGDLQAAGRHLQEGLHLCNQYFLPLYHRNLQWP